MISIGETFLEERRRQRLTIEEVSKATKIRPDFLRAIENGEFSKLPSPTYAYGFIRNYAKFLGLPVERSLAVYRREYDEKKNVEVLPKGLANPNEYSPSKFRIGRSMVLVGGMLSIIFLFLVYQYRSAIFNPPLKVDYPKENETVNSLTFEVRGKTDPNATLEVDNETVSISQDGTFKKQITLFPGSSTLNFKVVNRFGRETTLIRRIVVKQGY